MHPVEGEALYLLILHRSSSIPLYYSVQWNKGGKELAKSIRAMQRVVEKGRPLMIKGLFEKSFRVKRQVYPKPQQALTHKKPPLAARRFGSD